MQAVADLSSAPPSAEERISSLPPFLTAALVCTILAAISAAVLPTVPSYDPWSWIVWGREVVDPHLSFSVGGGPSWKPLPVMFTTVFGLFGGASPTLWVIAARAGGLLGMVAAYRLATRILAAPRWASVAAGVIAALAIALTQDWFYYMYRGTSEPMVIAATLWAIDRHLVGRRGWAFAFGVALALLRPEATPFLVAYGVYLWMREPKLRPLVVLGVLAVPVFWFVPPWIGSGHPFLAADHAKAYNGHLGRHKLLEVLRRGVDLQTVPVLIAALVAVGLAVRRRERLVPSLAVAAAAWWVLVVAMTLDGYPGLERFYLPAAAVACVLAGVGVVEVAQWVASRDRADLRGAGPGADRGSGGHAARPADRRRQGGRRPQRRLPVPLELCVRQPFGPDGARVEAPRHARPGGDHDAPSGPAVPRPPRLDRRRVAADRLAADSAPADRPRGGLECLPPDRAGVGYEVRRAVGDRPTAAPAMRAPLSRHSRSNSGTAWQITGGNRPLLATRAGRQGTRGGERADSDLSPAHAASPPWCVPDRGRPARSGRATEGVRARAENPHV